MRSRSAQAWSGCPHRGEKILSNDDILSSSACRFTLARDTWLQPLQIRDVRNVSSLEEGIIDIAFVTKNSVSSDALDLNKISFWLGNDDDYTRYQLYLWFSERLMDAELIVGDRRIALPDLWLDAAGFEREDALLPWPKMFITAIVYFRSISVTVKAFFSFICVMPYRCRMTFTAVRLRCVCVSISHYR